MSADLIRFVDSIDAQPVVRLDVNDERQWFCRRFSAQPPRLRRSVATNTMRDGVHVSSSQYEARTLVMEFDVISTSQDENAIQMQNLARELNRDGFIMYQPSGARVPVFFSLLKGEIVDVVDVPAQAAMRQVSVEVFAEPFALGLRETLGPYVVNNDPAAASNGCHFDVTGVVGDVASPFVMVDTDAARGFGVLAVRQHGDPTGLTFFHQLDSSGAADTSNPGGGPDALMSGTATNNYVRTTFATTPGEAVRTEASLSGGAELRGRYNLYAAVRRSSSTGVINVGFSTDGTLGGQMYPTALTNQRSLAFLGTLSNDSVPSALGHSPVGGQWNAYSSTVYLTAERVSGTATLDWDALFLIPADEATLVINGGGTSTTQDQVVDGYGEFVGSVPTGVDPLTTTASVYPTSVSGGFPSLVPNQTNRLYWLSASSPVSYNHAKASVDTWTIYYWPRYLYVRAAGA